MNCNFMCRLVIFRKTIAQKTFDVFVLNINNINQLYFTYIHYYVIKLLIINSNYGFHSKDIVRILWLLNKVII